MKYFLIITAFIIASCAQMVPPSGGPKDIMPPQVVEENTVPKNKTVNFNSKTIVISFDEYVKLNNPSENVIISPAMDEKPDYLLKGKKLYIKLKSELKPNTTYTLNFGNCITDITENNPAAGLTYVFSTGAVLDSLRLSGMVTNAFTNAPEKGVWVVLHRNLSDTAFQKVTPDYLTKTDANGFYSLQNLAAGEYQIFALKDGNSDYKYSQPSEEIAFHDNNIIIGEKNDAVNLRMFKEEEKKLFVKSGTFSWPGKINIVLNRKVSGVNCTVLPDASENYGPEIFRDNFYLDSDTLTFYTKIQKTRKEILVRLDKDDFHDTVSIRIPEYKEKPLLLKSNINNLFGVLDTLYIGSEYPVHLNSRELLSIYEDDSIPISTSILECEKNICLKYDWKGGSNYKIILKENCLQDDFGRPCKADTFEITPKKIDYYGSLFATLDFPEDNYYLEVQNSGQKTVFEFYAPVYNIIKIDLAKHKPGSYKLRLTVDKNNNQKWDTGNLSEKKQPERVYHYKEPIVIRSNWDFELTWKIEN